MGPWWTDNAQHEIDAVALAGRSRLPVLAGEAKWAETIDGRRNRDALRRDAALLPGVELDQLRLALCACIEVRSAQPDILTVTAEDIFATDAGGA